MDRRVLVLVVLFVLASSCGGTDSGDSAGQELEPDSETSNPTSPTTEPTPESEPTPTVEPTPTTEPEPEPTPTPEPDKEPDLDPANATEQDYVEALALSTLAQGGELELTEAQAYCLAEASVAVYGIDRMRAVGSPEAFGLALDVQGTFDSTNADAALLAPEFVACVPEVRTLIASSFVDAGGDDLSETERECVAAATEPVLVTLFADSLSDEFPSAFVISEDDALNVAQGLLNCSPSIGDFWRSGFVEGIGLARQFGAEPDDALVDCVVLFVDDELLVDFLAGVLRRDAGRADVTMLLETTTELMLEACA